MKRVLTNFDNKMDTKGKKMNSQYRSTKNIMNTRNKKSIKNTIVAKR